MGKSRNISWLIFFITSICFGAFGDKELEVDGAKLIWNNNSQTFSIAASGSMSASVDYIWPPADATADGQALLSNSSAVLRWGIPTTSASHNILSGTHDATTNAVTRGSLIYGNSTPKWDELVIGATNSVLWSNGTDVSWSNTPTITGLTITGCSVLGLNSAVFQPTTDANDFWRINDKDGNVIVNVDTVNNRVGIGGLPTINFEVITSTAAEGMIVGNVFIGLWDDNTDFAAFAHKDFRTTNSNTKFGFIQKKDGRTWFNGYNELNFALNGTIGLQLSPTGFHILSHTAVDFYKNATEGETQEIQLSGFGSGSGGKETLSVSVEKYTANVAEFFGLDAYMFQGNLITLNDVHSDADGARITRHDFKGEQSGGEQTTLARIEVGHDGSGDDEKGYWKLFINDGDDGDLPTQALEIGSDLSATFAGVITSKGDILYHGTSYILSGMSEDRQDMFLTTSAGNVFFETEKIGGGDIEYLFDEIEYDLDCTTGSGTGGRAQVQLTEGSATNPQINYVYITLVASTATLTASTSLPTGRFAWVALIVIQSDTEIDAVGGGPLAYQRFSETYKHDNRGALSYQREKIRYLGADYLSGMAQSLTITANGGADTVVLTTALGKVYQLHRQDWPVYDISSDGIWVANASGAGTLTNYQKLTDLNAILETTDGTTIGNNKRFNLVIWGSINFATSDCKLFVNLPTGVYQDNDQTISDENGTAVTTIPAEFQTTGFLIARLPLKYSSAGGGTWTNLMGGTSVIDLRGLPTGFNLGSGATVGSTATFSDADFEIFDNGDDTKRLMFQVSGVSTGNTRTLTVPDVSTKMWADNGSVPLTANWDVGAFDIRAATITPDGLTSGRVVFASTNGLLVDDADMTFSTDTLTVTKLGAFQAAGAINFDNQNMTNVDIDSGVITGITDLTIADGGTGQSSAQAAIDALSAVSGATNEHVLTKDTASGNAIWKVTTAVGGDVKVAIDAAAAADYIGAASNDGVLRTGTGITYADGGDFITLTPTGILGDGTAGRVLRIGLFTINNGTNANTLKCTLANSWNGDVIAETDNISKGATTGDFTLNAAGTVLTIEVSGLSGNVLGVLAVLTFNASGTDLTLQGSAVANDIQIVVRNATSSAATDMTVLVDTGRMIMTIMYITDA